MSIVSHFFGFHYIVKSQPLGWLDQVFRFPASSERYFVWLATGLSGTNSQQGSGAEKSRRDYRDSPLLPLDPFPDIQLTHGQFIDVQLPDSRTIHE